MVSLLYSAAIHFILIISMWTGLDDMVLLATIKQSNLQWHFIIMVAFNWRLAKYKQKESKNGSSFQCKFIFGDK